MNDIEIQIEDECLGQLVESLKDSDTPAADSVRKYFGVGKKGLRFHQSSDVDATFSFNVTGETFISNGTSQNINNMTIILNNIALANASQEYITETVSHEIWHASMHMNGIIPANNQDHIQHQNMLTNPSYLNQTVSSLQAQFPNLSTEDAKAIFFSGFGQFINSSTANRDIWLQALRNNNLTENFVNTRAEQYRTGQVGTPKCD